jgi:hypothetical protein
VSKRINVNPDHYKSQGRERPATLAAERMKMKKAVATSPAEGRRPPPLKKRPAARPPAPSKRSKGRPSSGAR